MIKARYQDAEIITEAASGAKERKIFSELLEKLQNGDTLVICKLDRFCRTVKEGLEYIDYLREKGVSIHILNLGIIENTPMGKMIVTSLLCYAEFERSTILERCASGKAIAKQDPNFKEGRPKLYSKEQRQHAFELILTNNYSYRQIEAMTGISIATLHRIRRAAETKEILKEA